MCVRERNVKRSIKCSRPLLQKESRVKRNEEIENKKGKGLDLILHIPLYIHDVRTPPTHEHMRRGGRYLSIYLM